MHRPKMILFDYAHTLAWEPSPDFLRGEEAVFRYVKDNPRHVTPRQASALGTEIWLAQREARHGGVELHEHQQLRLKYDALGLTFSLPMEEVEILLWTATTPGEAMPGAADMLAGLRERGIRTGVISNLGWSENALTDRLRRLLPGHAFDIVLVSSEYGLRKPHPLLFQAALSKAGLAAEDAWFCGDQIEADVHGAQGAGMFPVWYECTTVPNGFAKKNAGMTISGPCLHIHHWDELLRAIDECEE